MRKNTRYRPRLVEGHATPGRVQPVLNNRIFFSRVGQKNLKERLKFKTAFAAGPRPRRRMGDLVADFLGEHSNVFWSFSPIVLSCAYIHNAVHTTPLHKQRIRNTDYTVYTFITRLLQRYLLRSRHTFVRFSTTLNGIATDTRPWSGT